MPDLDGPRSSCPHCHASALWLWFSTVGLTLTIITCSCCGWNGYEHRPLRERHDEPDVPVVLPVTRPNRSARGKRNLTDRPPKCHPEAEHFARGLCTACYFRWYKKARPAAKVLAAR